MSSYTPEEVMYNIYTLFCRIMLENLGHFREAITEDTNNANETLWLDINKCITFFNDSLSSFFENFKLHYSRTLNYEEQLEQAFQIMSDYIEGNLRVRFKSNNEVKSTFTKLIEEAKNRKEQWSYKVDIENFHEQGRVLATEFFAQTTWAKTKQKLFTKARLKYESNDCCKKAPVAYVKTENSIVIRFSTKNESHFHSYLAFPFLFLHEYSSHVFADTVSGASRTFNDGWMLPVQEYFLVRGNGSIKLDALQIWVFSDYLLRQFDGRVLSMTKFVRGLRELLNNDEKLMKITYELATMPAVLNMSNQPYDLIKLLRGMEKLFDTNREQLISLISTLEIKDLYKHLDTTNTYHNM